ncbi:MAG TPA: class I SAM-dependent methyltransferase [Longimicrobium sp.]
MVANTAPAHLALCSRWHGGPRPPLRRYRLAELGCGDGANLLALAFYDRESAFVGVDASAAELERACMGVRCLGLANVRLIRNDVRDVDPGEIGECDYMVAHGLYSWVPEDARAAILGLCRRCLAPAGLAYVSYNAQPGWATRRMVRETLLRSRAVRDAPVEEKAARAIALAAELLEDLPSRDYAHAVLLADEMERVRDAKPGYVFHEHLAEVNDGFWLGEFVEQACGHGLDYVGDAQFCRWEGHVPSAISSALARRELDPVEREEAADLLGDRYFRQSILCRADAPREPGSRSVILDEVHLATSLGARSDPFDLTEGVIESFDGQGGPVVTLDSAITKAAVVLLAAQWPAGVPLGELHACAERLLAEHGIGMGRGTPAQLAEELTTLFEAGQVELRLREPAYDRGIPEHPRAHALARFEAAHREVLTTPYHLPLPFDPAAMEMVRALDGTRSQRHLWRAFGDELVDGTLPVLARWGLLEQPLGAAPS